MPKLISPSDGERLRTFFREAGYTEDYLAGKLGLRDLASSRLRNFPRLLDKTREPTCLNALLRWFWVGTPEIPAEESVPREFRELLLDCGLVRELDGGLVPQAMLMETNGFLVASDHTIKIDGGDPELVLWTNPTSRLLLRMTIRRPSRATLDLGTGTGIQALAAAVHSDRVVATDLNPRAIEFAAFNARLNGIENIETLTGSGFEPVIGRKFDLIVSNPPFFISPSSRYLFCDSDLELDQLCRQLARKAPNYLNEGGYFQMLCEWSEVKGQPWQERITEWLANIGCDAWVMKGYTQDPAEYAEDKIRSTYSTPERDSELYNQYMEYYRQRRVEAISGGAIVLLRRSGRNWLYLEEISHTPKEPFGDAILQTFAARNFLEDYPASDQLMIMKPRLSPDARLEQVLQQENEQWKRTSLNLRMVKGFPFFVGVQPLVAEFLALCDGSRGMGDMIQTFADKVNAPREQVETECVQVIRRLTERGFVLW